MNHKERQLTFVLLSEYLISRRYLVSPHPPKGEANRYSPFRGLGGLVLMSLCLLKFTIQIVLNTYGTLLNRDNEAFVVTNDQGKRRIPTDGVTSIMLTRGTSITSDAVLLAIEREIEIHFADRQGNIQGMVWSHKFGSVSTIRKGQLEFCRSAAAVHWIRT